MRPTMSPEALNTIDVVAAFGKFVVAVIDPKVLAITDINQAVITAPAVCIDDALQFDFAAYNRLSRGFRAILNDFRIDVTVPLKDAEDDRFAISAPASFPFDAARTKE